MRDYDFVTLDVFTDRRFGGNPLAVFTDAVGLSGAEMQAIATEMNLSETSFVLPPADPAHTAQVRIFTPKRELPFAGHPNVGTGYVLAGLGRARDGRLVFEELAGLVVVEVLAGADGAVLGASVAAPLPLTVGADIPVASIAACVGLQPEDIRTNTHKPLIAGVGVGCPIAEVTDRQALARAVPSTDKFQAAIQSMPALAAVTGLLLYTRDQVQPTRIDARMFAPLDGIPEDPATGSACASLSALLLSLDGEQTRQYEITQGVEMGRPSLILGSARRNGDAIRAKVAGHCVKVTRGTLSL